MKRTSRPKSAHGEKAYFDALLIPSVAYTDPEVAWVGMTEDEGKAKGIKYGKAVFPWAASGRAIANGRDEGFTKLLFDEETHRIDRRRDRRHERGRPDQRDRARDRDGRRRDGYRQDDPSASDARRIDRHGGRVVRRRLHRPAAAAQEVSCDRCIGRYEGKKTAHPLRGAPFFFSSSVGVSRASTPFSQPRGPSREKTSRCLSPGKRYAIQRIGAFGVLKPCERQRHDALLANRCCNRPLT